jgi:hypothetical protein
MNDALALRIRDRFLIRQAVREVYTDHNMRTASWAPEPEIIQAIVEGLWEPRVGSTDREAGLGILRKVKQLLGFLKAAPGRAWKALQKALGLDELEGLGFGAKVKAIGGRVKTLVSKGKAVLVKVFKKMAATFPLSLYFVPKGKMPSLTDILAKIAKKSPKVWGVIQKIKGGAEVLDKWLKKYIPRTSRVLYGAIFAFIWVNVAEISWDFEGLIAGFSGAITLPELLASLPESAIGLLASMAGLGFGALPVTLILRLVWLVKHNYLEWTGRGFVIRWDKLGVPEAPEAVPV